MSKANVASMVIDTLRMAGVLEKTFESLSKGNDTLNVSSPLAHHLYSLEKMNVEKNTRVTLAIELGGQNFATESIWLEQGFGNIKFANNYYNLTEPLNLTATFYRETVVEPAEYLGEWDFRGEVKPKNPLPVYASPVCENRENLGDYEAVDEETVYESLVFIRNGLKKYMGVEKSDFIEAFNSMLNEQMFSEMMQREPVVAKVVDTLKRGLG